MSDIRDLVADTAFMISRQAADVALTPMGSCLPGRNEDSDGFLTFFIVLHFVVASPLLVAVVVSSSRGAAHMLPFYSITRNTTKSIMFTTSFIANVVTVIVVALLGLCRNDSGVAALSVDRQRGHTTYLLQPWAKTTRNSSNNSSRPPAKDLVKVNVDFTESILKVTTENLTAPDDHDDDDSDDTKPPPPPTTTTRSTMIQVPIPDQEGNIASSLWPAAAAASAWWTRYGEFLFLSNKSDNDIDNNDDDDGDEPTRILELGSGLGVTGWMTAAVTAGNKNNNSVELTLTDQDDDALARLASSASYNSHLPVSAATATTNDNNQKKQKKRTTIQVTAQSLDWRDEHPPFDDGNDDDKHKPPFDIVVGSDLAYYHFLVGPLADTVHKFATDRALVTLASNTSRKSFWALYHLIKDGGYNVKTDTYGAPWPGTVRVLLQKMYCLQDQSLSPMAILCWTANPVIDARLERMISDREDEFHVATEEDEAAMEMSF